MTGGGARRATPRDWSDAQLLWDYQLMGHPLRTCDAAIGLGSHDLGVAAYTAELYHRGMFPVVVFSGATSPTTVSRFPHGEAVAYREEARRLGVPDHAILVEPHAANTGQNLTLSHQLLERHGIETTSVLLVSKPYAERRAYATCRRVWPEVEPTCASSPDDLRDYVDQIGDAGLVLAMLVGDVQRVIDYPRLGFAVEQEVPAEVIAAYRRLVEAGHTRRLAQS